MRSTPRRRRTVPRPLLMVLRVAFRYSWGRDAYVLRLIGDSRGPVLVQSGVIPAEADVPEPVPAAPSATTAHSGRFRRVDVLPEEVADDARRATRR